MKLLVVLSFCVVSAMTVMTLYMAGSITCIACVGFVLITTLHVSILYRRDFFRRHPYDALLDTWSFWLKHHEYIILWFAVVTCIWFGVIQILSKHYDWIATHCAYCYMYWYGFEFNGTHIPFDSVLDRCVKETAYYPSVTDRQRFDTEVVKSGMLWAMHDAGIGDWPTCKTVLDNEFTPCAQKALIMHLHNENVEAEIVYDWQERGRLTNVMSFFCQKDEHAAVLFREYCILPVEQSIDVNSLTTADWNRRYAELDMLHSRKNRTYASALYLTQLIFGVLVILCIFFSSHSQAFITPTG